MNFDHNLWGRVVPDGPRFCHWGGRRMSRELVRIIKIKSSNRILDLCCGQGGLTDYTGKAKLVVGIDTSKDAIKQAQEGSTNLNTLFLIADARSLPFPDNSFDIVICQDADAWMYKDKDILMKEVNRVLCSGGLLLWQSYASNESKYSTNTKRVLRNVGYIFHELPYFPRIKNMFNKSGFTIFKFKSLHRVYSEDNIKMLTEANRLKNSKYYMNHKKDINSLVALLKRERYLFSKKLWTGVLVVAQKRINLLTISST